MAEKLVSAGVFTRENDLSFLQQGVADIGAAFIGPFKEGPVVPTIVNSQAEFTSLFGAADGTYYTPLAVQNYLREAGTATICRVAGVGGYTAGRPLILLATSASVTSSVGFLFPTFEGATGLSGSSGSAIISGIASEALSLDPSSPNNIEAEFGPNPLNPKVAYVYGYFKNEYSSSAISTYPTASAVALSVQVFSGSYGNGDACEALTPMIQSQLHGSDRFDLFRFETLGVGNSANTKVKIGISNIKPAGSVNGTDYGTFTVTVREFSDTNKKKVVLETYSNVNLDPNSPNFISRVIGDRKLSIDELGKITETGDWVNNSKYIRVADLNTTLPVQAVPFGHHPYLLPVNAGGYNNSIPEVTFVTASSAQYGGIDLDFNGDNNIYLKPIPNGVSHGLNSAFGLDVSNGGNLELTGSLSTDVAKRQFVVAFQEGFDGMSPLTPINLGELINEGNSQGFDLTNSTSKGSISYMKSISALSNADEFDINMVITPGVVQRLHPYISNAIVDLCEQRSDCFYIMDGTTAGDTISQATIAASAIDSNYVGTYYPWVKTIDINTNKLITVPPSVLLPGVFAANDRVAAEWFAPAGLNRGGLVGAVSVLNRLTQSEKDELYEGKVNPIVQFPGQGIVVFGQKTLQDRPSALDRINVRRLLLTVRKYIASTSRFLVFEQNTSTTRNRI